MSDPSPPPHRTVIDLLDALEAAVVNGRRVPFTPNVMVAEEEALDLIDRARTALPEEIKLARVVAERQGELLAAAEEGSAELAARARAQAEATLAAAHAEAARLSGEARERAEALVSQNALVASARARSEALDAEAAAQAQRRRDEADAYAREVMEGLEAQLERALAVVRKGIEALPPSPRERP